MPITSIHSSKYSTQYFLVFSLLMPHILIGIFFRPSRYSRSRTSSSGYSFFACSGLIYSPNRKLYCKFLSCFFRLCKSLVVINWLITASLTTGGAHWYFLRVK